jgi:hypothetical protein
MSLSALGDASSVRLRENVMILEQHRQGAGVQAYQKAVSFVLAETGETSVSHDALVQYAMNYDVYLGDRGAEQI